MKSAFLALSLIFSVSTLASTKDFPKKGWKKIENYHGWSMQYPGEWKWQIQDDEPTEQDDMPDLLFKESKGKKVSWYALVTVESKGPYDFKFPLKELMEGVHGSSPAVRGEEGRETRVDGYPAYDEIIVQKAYKSESKLTYTRTIYINKDGSLYFIQYREGDGQEVKPRKEWKHEAIFNEMLSTFKFIKPHPEKI